MTPSPRYRDPLLERVKFRAGGQTLAIDQAESVYAALRRTPFVSLYGSSNWYDDLAEYVTLYHLTEVLGQPYRIVIRKEGKEAFAYEPMKSDLVRGRVGQMKRFYEDRRVGRLAACDSDNGKNCHNAASSTRTDGFSRPRSVTSVSVPLLDGTSAFSHGPSCPLLDRILHDGVKPVAGDQAALFIGDPHE